MSGIAQYLVDCGYHVCGSDRTQNEYTQKLQSLGVQVQGEGVSVANYQLVVRTSAIKQDHNQIVEAKALGIPVILREQLLGCIFDQFEQRIAICGTHGKTTATAMLHHILQKCNVMHTAFVGGNYQGGNYFGGGNIVVAEACEYNASFLHLHPTHTLCLNIEYDHPDFFDSLQDVQRAFCQLFEQSDQVVLPQDLQDLCTKGISYNHFVAKNLVETPKCTLFDLYHKQTFVARCKLPLVGIHNVTNAIAVVSLCHQMQMPLLQVCNALATFDGVDRRWTKVPSRYNVICDYAHHPTEIATTVATAKGITRGKVICIFQPHTYSRTKAFWQQFASCFCNTTVVYLPIYSARESAIDGVTSQNLQKFAKTMGIDAHYCTTFDQAKQFVESIATTRDVILILGAGDIVSMAKMFAQE